MLRRRWTQCLLAVCCSMFATSAWSDEPTARSVGGLSLRVDADLEIESVATPELIKWPIVADWDSQGRLVVAECGGVAKPITEHNKQQMHRIVRLVDSNGDGKFDKRIVAVDKLAFPEGVLCIGNAILVSAPPEIWKFTDAEGDGVCEQREVWFNPGTITGCANDLHGPYLGRDGWIYWCKGAFAEQKHELISGKQLTTKAAHIFRRRFEGGPIEPVMTGGMDNPVEMAISHTGERFFTSTFLQHPADGKRDGIAHALYGGVYGKQHDVLAGHVRTGELLPIMTHLGPAAPSGLICLEQTRLLGTPTTGIDTLVAAQFNLHKVTAHELVPSGAGFTTKDRELVSSERIDFHPTDVIEAADGSLLVLDTGGWYNLCCPSSHIDQSIAPGGIYRLTSATTRQTSAGPTLAWQSLGLEQATAIVRNSHQPLRDRQQALWRVCRIAGSTDGNMASDVRTAGAFLIESLKLDQASLRQIAAHSLSVQRIASADTALELAFKAESDAAAARAMAEALGRLGTQRSAESLLSRLSLADGDRMLEHSIIYALIELGGSPSLMTALEGSDKAAARAAMIALEQTLPGDRYVPHVWRALKDNDDRLLQTAADILVRHKEWAASDSLESNLAELWPAVGTNERLRSALARIFEAWSSEPKVIAFIAQRIPNAGKEVDQVAVPAFVDLISNIRNQALPQSWTEKLFQLMVGADQAQQVRLASWLGNMKLDESQGKLVAETIAGLVTKASENSVKLKLLAALRPGTKMADAATEQLILDHFLGQKAAETSIDASRALSRVRLTAGNAAQLVAHLDKVQPLDMMQALAAISLVQDEQLDQEMLRKLVTLPAARTLAFDQLTSLYRSRPDAIKAQVRSAVESLSKPPADVEAKLDELLGKLKSGDAARGFQVFRSAKAACSACHRIGYVGGTVGPELTRIGATRSRRALLEAIVFPNARLEQSYTPVRVLTSDGLVLNGLVVRETGDQLELVTGANQRITIPVSEIEQRQPSQVSIMPAGLEQQLSLDDLADLLTLLESAGR